MTQLINLSLFCYRIIGRNQSCSLFHILTVAFLLFLAPVMAL